MTPEDIRAQRGAMLVELEDQRALLGCLNNKARALMRHLDAVWGIMARRTHGRFDHESQCFRLARGDFTEVRYPALDDIVSTHEQRGEVRARINELESDLGMPLTQWPLTAKVPVMR